MVLELILVIIAIVVGFLIGKYITEQIKWADKKRLIDEKWKSKLESLMKDYQMELKKTTHDWELKYSTELAEIKELIQQAEKYMRQDAVSRSRRTLLGKLWEQVSPFIPKFPFKPSDMKFLGAPIDFVIFDGMGEKDIKKVVFLEVKSGDSRLNSQEKRLKEIIEDGKVTWRLFNIDKPEKLEVEKTEEDMKEKIEEETTPAKVYQYIDDRIESVKNSEEDEQEEN